MMIKGQRQTVTQTVRDATHASQLSLSGGSVHAPGLLKLFGPGVLLDDSAFMYERCEQRVRVILVPFRLLVPRGM